MGEYSIIYYGRNTPFCGCINRLSFTGGFCTRSDFPPSTATSCVGEKVKESVGERIVVTIVNRDVPFIYIKYKWKKWKGKT
jgi:hypothetical protein